MIRFTEFLDEKARTKSEESEPSLDALAERIRLRAAPTKSLLPWIKLAKFSGKPSEKGCLRYDAAVVSLTGCEADYDGGTMPMQHAAARLGTAGMAALLYATQSSTPEKPRWLIMAPFP